MEQFILMFGLDKDKEKAVRTVCSRIGAVPVTVERRDYSQKLGTLAGVQGFSCLLYTSDAADDAPRV